MKAIFGKGPKETYKKAEPADFTEKKKMEDKQKYLEKQREDFNKLYNEQQQ